MKMSRAESDRAINSDKQKIQGRTQLKKAAPQLERPALATTAMAIIETLRATFQWCESATAMPVPFLPAPFISAAS